MHYLPLTVFSPKDHRNRRANGVISHSADLGLRPALFAPRRQAPELRSLYDLGPTNSPSLTCDAACSAVLTICSHPCAGGPKGLARVTSSRWENSFSVGSGFPFKNSFEVRSNARLVDRHRLPQPFRDHLHRWHVRLSQGDDTFVTCSRSLETPSFYHELPLRCVLGN
jgi:hypothetical protein